MLPLDSLLRECGDAGEPIVAAAPESATAQAIVRVAEALRELERNRGTGVVTKSLPLVS